jgi:putative tricarboxylic transport membrane protein
MTMCDLTEVAGFIQSGDVKVLAVLSDERAAAPFDNIPTAKEQGLDVVGYNWRGFYTGKDVPDEAYQGWIDIMHKLYDSKEWQDTAKANGLQLFWKSGAEFEAFVREDIDKVRTLVRDVGMMQ